MFKIYLDFVTILLEKLFRFKTNNCKKYITGIRIQNWIKFFLQNDLHNERKFKINYIQQCPNWYFVTKKENVKTIVNKITKQNKLVKSVTGDEKHN